MQLPFLVVHGGWLWPVIGVALIVAAYAIVRRIVGLLPKLDSDLAKRMQRRRMLAIVPTPVIAAVMMGFIYFTVMCGAGDALTSDDRIDGYRTSNDPSVASRLVFAAATPKRREALEQLYVELAPRTRHQGVLGARMELLRLLGGHCERIVTVLGALSHHEAALAEAARCSPTATLFDDVEDSSLALARFADAAKAIERQIELSRSERSWTLRDLSVLAAARQWATLDRAATSLAHKAGASEAADVLTCIALAARHRGGNPAALAELRAQPLVRGKAACRLFAADATGALEDLQVLSPFPLAASHLAAATPSEPTGADLVATYTRIVNAVKAGTPVAPPYALAPSVYTEELYNDIRGPASWRGEHGQPDGFEQLRLLVLATHAPGEPRNLMYPHIHADVNYTLSWVGLDRGQLGMRLRAARALWPHHASGMDTANALVPLLYQAGQLFIHVGEQARGEAHLKAAIELDVSIASNDRERRRLHERAGPATITALLRRGDSTTAAAVFDQLVAIAGEGFDKIFVSDLLARLVTAGRGERKGLQQLAGLNIENQWPAIEKALAGDGRALAELSYDDLDNLRRSLPLLAFHVKDGSTLTQLVRNYPHLPASSLSELGALGDQLFLAEAARDEVTVKQLKARLQSYIEVMSAKDTSLLLAVIGALE